ncbi:MAG: SIMPL domain-containing protein [Flavobacteriia bacterium]|nr:SIMPL domain-containing protein [Flavobacteriia bacterium]OJX36980.1 MAG: SIMPL domain-containing protein [Flavobacteriia bacterium 40-80]
MKNYLGSAIIGIAVVIAAIVLGNAYAKKFTQNDIITVTGLGEEDFSSDLIVWNASFRVNDYDLSAAYKKLEKDRNKIRNYFISKGIKKEQIVFSSVDISKDYDYQYNDNGNLIGQTFRGYSLNQLVTIESSEVDKVEVLSRESTELINDGIELFSNPPSYYYTKLAELKLKMIENATKDAYGRAKIIAENAGGKLGDLKSSSMGVIQINGRNSNDDYSWGGNFNTSSKLKTASITIRLEYEAK